MPTLIIFIRPEVHPRVVPPVRLGQRGIQYRSANPLSPPFRDDEQMVGSYVLDPGWPVRPDAVTAGQA
jgi:hypothetical protein